MIAEPQRQCQQRLRWVSLPPAQIGHEAAIAGHPKAKPAGGPSSLGKVILDKFQQGSVARVDGGGVRRRCLLLDPAVLLLSDWGLAKPELAGAEISVAGPLESLCVAG